MLRGYENITYELTEEELKYVDPIVKGLSARIGKENAVTNKTIQDSMGLTSPRVHKIINYIRINNLFLVLVNLYLNISEQPRKKLQNHLINLINDQDQDQVEKEKLEK